MQRSAAVRVVVVVLVLAGCAEPRLPDQPLPPPAAQAPSTTSRLGPTARFVDGELMVWQVAVGGGTRIGRAELRANREPGGSFRINSRFRTEGLAARLRPRGYHHRSRVGPAPSSPLDLHGALGAIRAWASSARGPARAVIVHDGARYRLELAAPVPEREFLRIDGRARAAGEGDIELRLWLSTDGRALPLELEVIQDGARLVATLIDYAAP